MHLNGSHSPNRWGKTKATDKKTHNRSTHTLSSNEIYSWNPKQIGWTRRQTQSRSIHFISIWMFLCMAEPFALQHVRSDTNCCSFVYELNGASYNMQYAFHGIRLLCISVWRSIEEDKRETSHSKQLMETAIGIELDSERAVHGEWTRQRER